MGCGAPVHPLLIMKSTAKPQRVCARAGHVQQGSFNTRNLWVAGTNNCAKVLGKTRGHSYDLQTATGVFAGPESFAGDEGGKEVQVFQAKTRRTRIEPDRNTSGGALWQHLAPVWRHSTYFQRSPKARMLKPCMHKKDRPIYCHSSTRMVSSVRHKKIVDKSPAEQILRKFPK
jgi:hypothetical protein